MLRKVVRRGFCVNNNDPIHARNYQNDHSKAMWNKLRQQDSTQIRSNFQKLYHDRQYLEKNQIQTRILKILYDSELVERIDKYNFSQDLRRQLNLDSLNVTVILTSIQHQFTTVFEDRIFESVRNLEEIVTLLVKDPKIF